MIFACYRSILNGGVTKDGEYTEKVIYGWHFIIYNVRCY